MFSPRKGYRPKVCEATVHHSGPSYSRHLCFDSPLGREHSLFQSMSSCRIMTGYIPDLNYIRTPSQLGHSTGLQRIHNSMQRLSWMDGNAVRSMADHFIICTSRGGKGFGLRSERTCYGELTFCKFLGQCCSGCTEIQLNGRSISLGRIAVGRGNLWMAT